MEKKNAAQINALFVSTECLPYAKASGLAEYTHFVSSNIAKGGNRVKVILPLYKEIYRAIKSKLSFVFEKTVFLGERKSVCGIYSMEKDNIQYLFAENNFYFDRKGIYGHFDDGERFAFLCKIALETVIHIKYSPCIIHCCGYNTSLLPVYIKSLYEEKKELCGVKTVLYLDEIMGKGNFCFKTAEEFLNLPKKYHNIVEFEGCCNIIKGGILCCDVAVMPKQESEISSGNIYNILTEYAHKIKYIANVQNINDNVNNDNYTWQNVADNYMQLYYLL